MGYFSELDITLREAAKYKGEVSDAVVITPEQAVERLGGEIDAASGHLYCPGPGQPPEDRSLCLKLNDQGEPYLYGYCGARNAALAYVRAKLELPEPEPRDHSRSVLRIWGQTRPIEHSMAARYLAERGLTLRLPPSLRYHPKLWHTSGDRWPALVAERTDVAGNRLALHRTWIDPGGKGKKGKAPVEPAKKDLGPSTGTAIRLAPIPTDEELLVGEGIETTLSVMQITGLPGWAGGGHLKTLQLPPEVRHVVVLADGDPPGHETARVAYERWSAEGRSVRVAYAPDDLDFNDVLMGKTE